MQTKVSEQEKKWQAEQAASREYKELLKNLAAEERADGSSTEFGKMRRYTRDRQQMGWLARLFNNPMVQGMVWTRAIDGANDLLKAVTLLAQQWPSVTEHQNERRYVEVSDTLAEELGVEFAQVAVSSDVARRIEDEIAEVRAQDMIIAQRFEKSGFMGPFAEEQKRYNLMQQFRLRHDHDTDTYAHCINRVQEIQHDVGCDGTKGTCVAHVFGVVSLQAPSGRKPGIRVAEAGAEMTVRDQQAVEKATPVISVPPSLNFVP